MRGSFYHQISLFIISFKIVTCSALLIHIFHTLKISLKLKITLMVDTSMNLHPNLLITLVIKQVRCYITDLLFNDQKSRQQTKQQN